MLSTDGQDVIEEIELKPRKWNKQLANTYSENINRETIDDDISDIDKLSENFSKEQLNVTVGNISSLFVDTATNTFGYNRRFVRPKRGKNKAWFGSQCRLLRRKYTEARTAYKKLKTMDNKQRPLNASKQYKNAILKHSRKHHLKTEQEITKLSRYEPRAVWKLLKEKQSDSRLPPLETLYEYLKDVNSSQDTTPQPDFNTDSDSNSILNIPISQEEILSVVKSLKNNKASGPDKILNEYIKQTIDCMINVYVKLFNLIFEKGVFPDSWLIGIIKPIYKTGDKHNP